MKLFRFLKKLSGLKAQKGFTLIELLVVIGVLGILATGLLATIDPLEQFRKGGDSNERTTALELENALTRYYSTHQTFPWRASTEGADSTTCNGNGAGVDYTLPQQVSTLNGTTAFDNCLTVLTQQGELKASFQKQYPILGRLWVTDTTAGNAKSSVVCYSPTSKSESLKTETSFDKNGTTLAGCPKNPPDGTCYWCAK